VGEQQLREMNPRLIYCSISGFGATGPRPRARATTPVAQAASGYLKLLVNPANPRVVGPAIADAVTGFYAAYGVLGALYERSRTGRRPQGRSLDARAMAHWNLDAFTHYYSAGEVMGPFSRPRVSQSYVMECKDGKWVALHMSSPEKFWQGLANAIERPALFQDPALRDARRPHRQPGSHDRSTVRTFRHANPHRVVQTACWPKTCRMRPMYDTSEALQDPQAQHLQLLCRRNTRPWASSARCALRCRSTGKGRCRFRPPPTLGEHNGEIDAMLAASERTMTLKVGLFIGSLRKASSAAASRTRLGELAPPGLALNEIAFGDLPLYNADLEPQTPQPWLRFRAQVLASDALLFVIPEYNRSIPGGVKNAIDVASKPTGQNCWSGKPALVVTPEHRPAGRAGRFLRAEAGAGGGERRHHAAPGGLPQPHRHAVRRRGPWFPTRGAPAGVLASFETWIKRFVPR
jgi:crotonobetainyl-CoA:carnitine CoA-transferase CaiB-like acyl-CoA transferase